MPSDNMSRPTSDAYREGWERIWGKRNDGWDLCAVEGCGGQPRLSGLCPIHEALAWKKMLDMPAYSEPNP